MAVILHTKRLQIPREADESLIWTVVPLAIILGSTVPIAGAGISLLAGAGGGLYWLVPELILAFTGAILNAWILLVEIQR